MNNSKFLKIIILLLVLLNTATISFMWLNRPRHNDKVGLFFAKELQFTPEQQKQFEQLKEAHQRQHRMLMHQSKIAHDAYFDLLKNDKNDSVTIAKAAEEIIKIKRQEELLLFHHFEKIRAICDQKQKQKFDKIIKDASQMMTPEQPPRGQRPPPKMNPEEHPHRDL